MMPEQQGQQKTAKDATAAAAEEQKSRQARVDYDGYLRDVLSLKQMTDTDAWKAFYGRLRRMRAQHGHDVLNAEKSREIVRHQEGVKLIDEVTKCVQQPVENLSNFCNSMPLFAATFDVRAAWNEAIGIVELSKLPTGAKAEARPGKGKKLKKRLAAAAGAAPEAPADAAPSAT